MTTQLKLRIIGGPNGSGKSYFIDEVKDKNYFRLINYVNADDIERALKADKQFSLVHFNINTSQVEFENHITNSSFSNEIKESARQALTIEENKIKLHCDINSYHSAIISDFIRTKLLKSKHSFVFETVMSHPSKLDFIQKAKDEGYKIYFYFLCTESVELNKIQVNNRVELGGHFVPESKIEGRYTKTLNNLQAMIQLSDVCYCINNKGSIGGFEKVAEIVNGQSQNFIANNIPNWFQNYYLTKLTT